MQDPTSLTGPRATCRNLRYHLVRAKRHADAEDTAGVLFELKHSLDTVKLLIKELDTVLKGSE